jgi:hypothetical protein
LLDALDRSLSYQIADTVFEQILDDYRPARISRYFFEAVTQRLFAPQTDLQGVDLHA